MYTEIRTPKHFYMKFSKLTDIRLKKYYKNMKTSFIEKTVPGKFKRTNSHKNTSYLQKGS